MKMFAETLLSCLYVRERKEDVDEIDDEDKIGFYCFKKGREDEATKGRIIIIQFNVEYSNVIYESVKKIRR